MSDTQNKNRGANDQEAKSDPFAENIHYSKKHEDPSIAVTLQQHNENINDFDKFVEYVYQVENSKK